MKSVLRFQAETAVPEGNNKIWIDGKPFFFEDGFEDLEVEDEY